MKLIAKMMILSLCVLTLCACSKKEEDFGRGAMPEVIQMEQAEPEQTTAAPEETKEAETVPQETETEPEQTQPVPTEAPAPTEVPAPTTKPTQPTQETRPQNEAHQDEEWGLGGPLDQLPNYESRNNREPSAPVIQAEPVQEHHGKVLYEDDYCTLTMTAAPHLKGGQIRFTLVPECKIEGNVTCEIGESLYINDAEYQEKGYYLHAGQNPGQDKNEYSLTFFQNSMTNAMLNNKLEVIIKLTYDNGQPGVYKDRFVLVNDLFCINEGFGASSNKHVSDGSEIAHVDLGGGYVEVLECGKAIQNQYYVRLYLENTSDETIRFAFANSAIIVSDQQEDAKGYVDVWPVFTNCPLVAPGKGLYYTINMTQSPIDNFAKDRSEVITMGLLVELPENIEYKFPVVHYYEHDAWADNAVRFTRDDLNA